MTTSIVSAVQSRNLLVEDFDFLEKDFKERLTEFKEDPLVLSTCLYRLLQEVPNSYYGLEHEVVYESITEEDREVAEKIRKYYTKKFFWTNFTQNISSFRSRMVLLLETRERNCKDQDCGIYYKLPWFYHEDMIYDEFKKQYNTSDIPNVVYGIKAQKSLLKLSYLKSTVCRQRKRKIERFWFTDQKYLYCVELDQENPLIDMFRSFLETKDVTIESFRAHDRIDQMQYYKLFKFNFVKEQNA